MVGYRQAYRLPNIEKTLEQINKEDCTIMAGGTDLMVMHKSRRGIPAKFDQPIVFIDHLKELKQVVSKGQFIHIGACCTYTELLDNPLIPDVLKKAIKNIAAPAIRNRGTLGGNVCNASPAGDTLPLLYVYNASVLLRSTAGDRVVGIQEFIQGPRRIDRLKNEIVVEIILPTDLEENCHFVFEKVANRRADAITKISFAGVLCVDSDKITDARFAFGSVGATIVRSIEIEQKLRQQSIPIDVELINAIVADFDTIIKPIDDQRSTANYRKTVALKLLRHFLEFEIAAEL